LVAVNRWPAVEHEARAGHFSGAFTVSEKSEQARRYRTFAEEARTYAIGSRSLKDRASLWKLAEEYERLAREIEALEATKEILRRAAPLSDNYAS
jgi:hypothetical protein